MMENADAAPRNPQGPALASDIGISNLEQSQPSIGPNPNRNSIIAALEALPLERRTEWLESTIRNSECVSGFLVQALVERIGANAVKERLSDVFHNALKNEPYATVARVYDQYLAGQLPSRADARVIISVRVQGLQTFFAFMVPPGKTYDVMGKRDTVFAAWSNPETAPLGGQLKAYINDRDSIDPAWQAVLAPVMEKPHELRTLILDSDWATRFFDRILEHGRLTMPDPRTGEPVACSDSILMKGVIYYTFRGSEPWILLAGTAFNRPLVAYYPCRRQMFCLYSGSGATSSTIARMPVALARLLYRFAALTIRKPPPRTTPEGPVLIIGTLGNPAHHLWNFLSGIERLRVCGRLGQVSRCIYGGTEFIGPIEEIFPEMQGRLEHPRNPTYLDPSPMDPTSLLVGVGGYYIPRTLTLRIIDLMKARPRTRFAEPADFQVPPTGRIVWFGLRVGDKVWLGQEEGIPAIISEIEKSFPGSVCVLDGYSYPIGRDLVSARWAPKIQETYLMAERIRAKCPYPDRVINTVGNTFREAVLWADACDAYLAPFGSAQHKVGWFSTRTGVVYVGPGFGKLWPERSPGALASEMSAPPHFIYGRVSSDKGSVSAKRANMELDTADLVTPLLRLLETTVH